MAGGPSSLSSLEEELTCSICLSIFNNPVTTPCGHNFCLSCLELTWKDDLAIGFSCPQCRHQFYAKPTLHKNTVLSSVVATVSKSLKDTSQDETKGARLDSTVIFCDTCMVSKASKTCLTCMVSYCDSHLRPHHENPVFQGHQLTEPLPDLQQRICKEHHKTLEFYCKDHNKCICGACLHSHLTCRFASLDCEIAEKEKHFKEKLPILRKQIEKTKNVIFEMKGQQSSLSDSAANRKAALEAEYRVMKDLIEKDEREAINLVDKEEQSAQARIQSLMHRLTKNIEEMSSCKDQIESVLAQGQRITLLQCTVEFPQSVTFTPKAPGINIDSKQMKTYKSSAVSLKKYLTDVLSLPVEERAQKLNAGLYNTTLLMYTFRRKDPQCFFSSCLGTDPTSVIAGDNTPTKKLGDGNKKSSKYVKPPKLKDPPKNTSCASKIVKPINPTEVTNRHDLLQNAAVLMLDARTAHKRIVLSDNFTKASVSDELMSYPDSPARFIVCSQVLCSKGFSRGRHYWEVKMTSSNFCAIGVASSSIERKGPTSKLGRNKASWCIEWFNVKLSAWHDNRETVLENPSSSRVGVLLDCDGGSLTFYSISDRVYPIHTFSCHFPEAVFPAFWLFSSGTAVSLCKLTA
ncbi:E3 ubiquitin/ISG15 ligase TRIM25-like isoform X5 [Acipenser oxyrinchus oxyrinchus]|uniref:E3 ubiquitin/ISG15 ligase TRIM25-like isoform X5 n=1 Tax=Acipenser oxyrinchus oxyrinchus TaxID=40147 RepID=A0AAD8D6V4_ACIOX|nr:E3 ubiquitin/ISG15 ligase TRIM25-like isoform X5 [Acipenser oxyrinchus oxyrinchus]